MREDFFDRLDKYMKFKELNDNQVTVQTGIPVGSLGKQRKKGRGLSIQNIAKILLKYCDLNPDWLVTGRGEMLLSEENTSLNYPNAADLLNRLEKKSEEVGRLKEEIQRLNVLLGIQEENKSKVG